MPALAVPLHVTGSIDEPGGVADHPVDLAQGQIVYLRGSGECGVDVTYQLLSPSGTALSGAPYVCSDHDRVVAPMAGTYTLQVRSWDGGTGPYDVEVVPVPPDDVVDVAVGDPLVGELTVSGEHDLYRFTGDRRRHRVPRRRRGVRRERRLRPRRHRRGVELTRRAVRLQRHRTRRAPAVGRVHGHRPQLGRRDGPVRRRRPGRPARHGDVRGRR